MKKIQINECLNSIFKSFKDFEIIIVDNSSGTTKL